jgi:hypothetical protein
MAVRHLYIDGTNITGTEIYMSKDWSIEEKINKRSTMSCTIARANGATISCGKEVMLYDGTTYIWGGVIMDISDFERPDGTVEYSLTIDDFCALVERLMITKVYENQTINAILTDFLITFATLGITEGYIELDLPKISRNTCNYQYGHNALDHLKDFGNYIWNIDLNKKFYFYSIGYLVSTTTLTDYLGFKRSRSLKNYRNTEYVRGKNRQTVWQSSERPTPTPDGNIQEFFTHYPIGKAPVIMVSISGGTYALKTIGIKGIDTGMDWYWTYGSTQVSQDSSGTKLTAADNIRISYYGLVPLFVMTLDSTEVSARGTYSHYVRNEKLESSIDALNYAIKLLEKYSNEAESISFSKTTKTYEAGMQFPVVKSALGINSTFLCEGVTWKPMGPTAISYEYKAIDGAALGGWEEFFKNLAKPESIETTDNEIIVYLKSWSEGIAHAGSTAITVLTPLYPSTGLYPSASLYPGTIIATATIVD